MMNYHQRIFGEDPDFHQENIDTYNKRIVKQMINFSPLSSAMLAVVIFMFVLCLVTDLVEKRFNIKAISGQTLVQFGANSSLLVHSQNQYYRIITAMFLHANFMHIAMNSFSLLMYCMPVQQKLKNQMLFAIVIFYGGMLGNCCSIDIALYVQHRSLLAVGASTSICSVIGFDMSYRVLHVDNMPLNIRRILITLVYIFIISLMPGVDFWGHFGSLFAGMLIGTTFLPPSCLYWSQKQIKMIKLVGLIGIISYSLLLIVPILV